MSASRFDVVLPLLKKKADGTQLGICAMGPIGSGDEIVWMRVWVWQQDGDNVPASSGNAGDHVPGAHALEPAEKPPFVAPKEEKWMVQTALEKDSPKFNHEKPALVQAIALVKNRGDSDIVQWSQAVGLREPHHHDGGDEPGRAHDDR